MSTENNDQIVVVQSDELESNQRPESSFAIAAPTNGHPGQQNTEFQPCEDPSTGKEEELEEESSQPKQDQSSWLTDNNGLVRNALYASNAIYKDNPYEFLNEHYLLGHHTMAFVHYYKQNDIHFLTAQDEGKVFLAFKGTTEFKEWADTNLKIKLKSVGGSETYAHDGFLKKAEKFPLKTLLSSNSLSGKDLVTCGHSQGGAVSSIIFYKLRELANKRELDNLGTIQNITFGSPMFGDTQLKDNLRDTGFQSDMYNIVYMDDPVPSSLCSLAVKTIQPLVQDPLMCALTILATGEMNSTKTEYQELEYSPIGNFIFLESNQSQFLNTGRYETTKNQLTKKSINWLNGKTTHSLLNYEKCLKEKIKIATPETIRYTTLMRPKIEKAAVTRKNNFIQVVIEGDNLGPDGVQQCQLTFYQESGLEQRTVELLDKTTEPEFTSQNGKQVLKFNYENYRIEEGVLKHKEKIFFKTAFGEDLFFFCLNHVETLPVSACLRMAFDRYCALKRFTNTGTQFENHLIELATASLKPSKNPQESFDTRLANFKSVLDSGEKNHHDKLMKDIIKVVQQPLILKTLKLDQEEDCKWLVERAKLGVRMSKYHWNPQPSHKKASLKIGYEKWDGESDDNYNVVLEYIVTRWAQSDRFKDNDEIGHLARSSDVFKLEYALCLMLEGNEQYFKHPCENVTEWKILDSDMTKVLEETSVRIRKIFEIRKLLASDVFIGLVGPQLAGKTTLAKKLCNKTDKDIPTDTKKGRTKEPKIYEIGGGTQNALQKLYIVDFPGLTSSEPQSDYFTNYGAMNNFLIVLLKGNETFGSDDGQKITYVLKLSHEIVKPSNILICMNRSGGNLDIIKRDFKNLQNTDEEDKETFKKHIIDRFREYMEEQKLESNIDEYSFFPTDWELDDNDARNYEIEGVPKIKDEIIQRLNLGEVNFTECELLKPKIV